MTAAEIDLLAAAIEKRLVDRVADAVEKRLEPRFTSIERKLDDLADLVQAMATGHAQRFNALEQRLGIDRKNPPPLRIV